MIYFVYLIGAFLTTVLCYLTNPLVVLFADEDGDLHGVLRYWQTWDDSLDSAYFMKHVIAKSKLLHFLDYDYDKHYRTITAELADYSWQFYNRSLIIKPLTTTEKIKRYVCRVLWLYRNNAYGFSFYLLGRDVDGADMIMTSTGDVVSGYSRKGTVWDRAWIYKSQAKICSWLRWEIFLGWKINYHEAGVKRAMLANRIAIRLI